MPHSQPTARQQSVCKFHLDHQYHISHWGSTILGDSTLWCWSHCYVTWCPFTTRINGPSSRDAMVATRLTPGICSIFKPAVIGKLMQSPAKIRQSYYDNEHAKLKGTGDAVSRLHTDVLRWVTTYVIDRPIRWYSFLKSAKISRFFPTSGEWWVLAWFFCIWFISGWGKLVSGPV